MTQRYICDCCGTESEDPHGCYCGGEPIPSDPFPDMSDDFDANSGFDLPYALEIGDEYE